MKTNPTRTIEVWADWAQIGQPTCLGLLHATPSRSKEIFSFGYDPDWLKSEYAQSLDPSLHLFTGPQYPSEGKTNFGMFLDSSPDRWGRLLMVRREAQSAREEGRPRQLLRESDFLLGVYDEHRMGALRFRSDPGGPFLDNNREYASPPWASLRELEHASLELERQGAENDPSYRKWLSLLIAPGGSLGGARPKAGVVDVRGDLWIAKFPSRADELNIGAWEYVAHQLACQVGILTADARTQKFNSRYHTFLTKRFDRTGKDNRLHFASAMTLLNRNVGEDASDGVSYLELAELLIRQGSQPDRDLDQLWRRIVFYICISNVDDHLRNHGFLLEPGGWALSPAYDMNPVPYGDGLKLNISDDDNAQDLDLAREVAIFFRIKPSHADRIIRETVAVVKRWRILANSIGIPSGEQERMEQAFHVADEIN